jgi:hypothetical protein
MSIYSSEPSGSKELKDDNCTHAWILSTGNPDDINDPLMSIQGRGAVDGAPTALSSARGELQGQTAMAIISQVLLQWHQRPSLPTILQGDNEGVQHTCSRHTRSRLRHHRLPNTDLITEFQAASANRPIKSEWIKGHQDDNSKWRDLHDLKQQKLSNPAILNVWCDREANNARSHYLTQTAEVYPNERWALYTMDPTPHKITGKLDDEILRQLYHESLASYIRKKHKLCPAKLNQTDTSGLYHYLKH